MDQVTSSLVNLQAIESRLRKTRKKLKKGQQILLKQEHHIKQLEAAQVAKHEEIKLTRLQHGKLELELRSREDEISRLRVALNNAKTNKDYSAILTRINTDKASQSKLEDQILALMTQIENDHATTRQIEEDIATEKARYVDIRQEIQQEQKTVQAEINELSEQYKEAAKIVPAKLLTLFERLAGHFEGEVLAVVERLNGVRGDYCCGGCFMSIPLESVNSLMTRDDVIICTNCGRILVLDKNPHQQPAS